jgi:hypothetical protein
MSVIACDSLSARPALDARPASLATFSPEKTPTSSTPSREKASLAQRGADGPTSAPTLGARYGCLVRRASDFGRRSLARRRSRYFSTRTFSLKFSGRAQANSMTR